MAELELNVEAKPEPKIAPQAGPSGTDGEKSGKLTPRERLRNFLRRVEFTVYTTLGLMLLALGFLWPRMFISIAPGSNGVMYRYFLGGTVTDRIWSEGLNIIPPWDSLTIYETRVQQKRLTFDVLSEEGLDLGVAISIRYRANKEMLGYLHQDIGVDYFDRLIQPEVEAHVRRTFGNRPAHEIYASARDLLQELGKVSAIGRLEEDGTAQPYVQILELKLVDVELPDIVENAIAEKYRQEQLMLEYRYKLEREEKEAERKRTEASGIRDYNMIASKVTPELLKWRSIEVQAEAVRVQYELAKSQYEIAKSNNAKVVIIGNGQGMPQALINVDSAMTTPTPPKEPENANVAGKTDVSGSTPLPPPATVPITAPTPSATESTPKEKPAETGKP